MATHAQPLVYQATGTREQVQAAVAQFEHDIVYGATGDAQHPPLNLGSYRVATFDDVPPTSQAFNLSSGGLTFLGGVAGSSRLFVSDNGGAAFSTPNSLSLTTIGQDGSGFATVFVPDFSQRFAQNAFGAVFANVPSGTVALEGGLPDGSRFSFEAEPATTSGQFSFLGIIDPQQFFTQTWVRMNATFSLNGTIPPGADAGIVDQIILGAAVPLPEPKSLHLLMAAAVVGGTTWFVRRARARLANG